MKARVRQLLVLFPFFAMGAFAEDAVMKNATFCRSVTEHQSPKDKAEFFYPDETVYLSVELKGRPKSGIAAARFLFRGELIADAKIDVADLNKGVLFSVGQSTFVGFNLTPSKNGLPIGDTYVAEVTFDGKPLGKFPFRIAPPKDAEPSRISKTVLAHGTDKESNPVGEATTFKPLDTVVLAGRGDLGRATWLEAHWIVNGKVAERGTRSVKLPENKKDVPFYFSFVPDGGWPEGEQSVVLIMNAKEVARHSFTITPGPAGAEKALKVTGVDLFHDDGKGEPAKKTDGFDPAEKRLHVRFSLAEPGVAYGTKIRWSLVKSAEVEPQEIASVVIKQDKFADNVVGSLSIKKSLPVGSYRVDLLKGDAVLGSKEFSVGEKSSVPEVGGELKK
jgi:hypothetical protein